MEFIKHMFKQHKAFASLITIGVFILVIYAVTRSLAVSGGPFTPGETLEPDCLPGGTCVVNIPTSQWTTSGSDIYFSGGNVGVGTSSPSVPLQVNGTFAAPASGGTTSTAIFRIDPAGKYALDFGIVANSYAWIQSYNAANTNLAGNGNLALNPNGGNVGVGTSSPTAMLTVNQNHDGVNPQLLIKSPNTATNGSYAQTIWTAGTKSGMIFQNNDSTTGFGGVGAMNMLNLNGPLVFSTSASNISMKIDGDGVGPLGYVVIGTPDFKRSPLSVGSMLATQDGGGVNGKYAAYIDHTFATSGTSQSRGLRINGSNGQTALSIQQDGAENFSVSTTGNTVITGTTTTLGGLIIETRTSDPGSPANGQLWLRTDL